MLKIKKTKKNAKSAKPEDSFQEAKVRIMMKVRGVTREKALVLLSTGDSSSPDSKTPPVTPAAMPGGEDDEFISAKDFFGE
ncbi:MAG: hypothetical protein ACI4TC_06100 [Kiritimatiellia bacterium]